MRGRDERGSAVPFVVTGMALLLVVAMALVVAGGLVRAHRSAQAAADLAALAAATSASAGRDPCAAGSRIAEANGARLTSCRVQGVEVTVQVAVPAPRWAVSWPDLGGEARAGPG